MKRPRLISAIRRRTALYRATGVPADTLSLNPATQSFAASLGTHLYPASLGRVLRCELGSLLGRIRALLRTQLHRRGLVLDPACATASTGEERKQAQDACSEDMRKLFAARPWLTLVDGEIFVLAWKQGAEWSDRNCRSKFPSSSPDSSARLSNSHNPN